MAGEINGLLERRKALKGRSPQDSDAHKARLSWIRTINALIGVLAMLEADEEPILGRVREAERNAEQRARSRASGGGSTDRTRVEDPPVTDPVVSTPVLTDSPATDPVVTDPPVTDPVVTDPPVTDGPAPPEPEPTA